MLHDDSNRDYENVFGLTYKKAADIVAQIEYTILSQQDRGFASKELCEQFAKENHLNYIVFIKASGTFRAVTHRGDALQPSDWKRMYKQILFYSYEEDEKICYAYWSADNYEHYVNARLYGEISDGKYQPLYYRDYFVPTGYFSESRLAFNVAKPISIFARNTGSDTSHIHELIRRISGSLYDYVLSWLRHKMLYPTRKTEVIPIFTGGQGTGKSTFGEVVCRALFGVDNVIVTDSYDSTSRFNADQVDALIISIEEKTQDDKKNPSAALKSKATARQVRKENKGVDPFYQESYTDFVMSTNEFVPIKFEDRGNQRRFMVMEGDRTFVRESNPLAEEVFTKLYGYDMHGDRVCRGLIEDKPVIEQFKYELWQEGAKVNYRHFPKTDAYERCFSVPRTNEAVEIETMIKALAPFIRESLIEKRIISKLEIPDDNGDLQPVYLDSIISDGASMQFVQSHRDAPARVAVNRQLVFSDSQGKSYAHSVVERTLLDLRDWFSKTYQLELLATTTPPHGGYRGVATRLRWSPTAWFILEDTEVFYAKKTMEDEARKTREAREALARSLEQDPTRIAERNRLLARDKELRSGGDITDTAPIVDSSRWTDRYYSTSDLEIGRVGKRVRYNNKFQPDETGEYETLNELKEGCVDRKSINCTHMDTFLLEADETTKSIVEVEKRKLKEYKFWPVNAETFYRERLQVQEEEAERLFNSGIVCRIVYSGTKSLHLLVRVKDPPTNKEERDWLDAYLKATLSSKLTFDPSTKDPARLTRAPATLKREAVCVHDDTKFTVGEQRLVAVNWSNVYDVNWRLMFWRWKNQPPAFYEERKKLLPSKPLYRDAVVDLLQGRFFTSEKWIGLRQEAFFPAYRLLREMGYGHEELWEEFHKQIDLYKKTKEIGYWHSRETSALIKEIDEDVDNG